MRKQIHLQCQLLKAAKSDDAKKLPSPPKDWKHSSNYFKNAFNRDEFGPVIKLKAPMSPKVDGEDMETNFQHWVGQIKKKKNPRNSDATIRFPLPVCFGSGSLFGFPQREKKFKSGRTKARED